MMGGKRAWMTRTQAAEVRQKVDPLIFLVLLSLRNAS